MKIKEVQSHNGKEFVNTGMDRILKESGIVLRNKYGPDGGLKQRKAHVVAKCFARQPALQFFETFAPDARLSSLRLLIALAVKFNPKIIQLDIETA